MPDEEFHACPDSNPESSQDGHPPTGKVVETDTVYEVHLDLIATGADPKYRFRNSKGMCHKRVGNRDHFRDDPQYGRDYQIVFRISHPKGWKFDNLDGPFWVINPEHGKFYQVSDKADTSFVLNVTFNKGSKPVSHAFNLFVLEETKDGWTRRKVDPDVDNPPLGFP